MDRANLKTSFGERRVVRSAVFRKSVFTLFCLPLCAWACAQDPDGPNADLFEKRITGYVAAFDRGDADAIAGFWSEQGEFVTPAGETLVGRAAISAKFKEWFSASGNGKLELVDPQVEIQSPGVAIETGIARVTSPGSEPVETGYRAVLVKSAEGWKIDRVSEAELEPAAPSSFDRLQQLEWMVGQWSSLSESQVVEAGCRWTANRNFLVQSYRVTPADGELFEVTQVIGWDPDAGSIRSWTFDSDGGFGAGRWSGGNGRWTCQSLGILPDGRRGTATHIYEQVDANSLRFSSIGRQVDGELLPDVEPAVMTRVTGSPNNN